MLGWLRRFGRPTGLAYWHQRAAQFGRGAVLNIGHPEEEFDRVTEHQRREIFPHLRQQLRGDEKLILDFGCGPGRFTADLAAMIGGRGIGVDPIPHFLELAPRSAQVEYRPMADGTLPVPSESVDVVWICLVLGGLVDPGVLAGSVAEIDRVLKTDGLLFVVENTSEQPDGRYWVFHSVADYIRLLPFARLVHLHDYVDLGERISIMAGRKCA